MSALLLTKPLEEDIGFLEESEDVPVNKKTSFNGRLNQYFHTAKNVATEPPTLKPTTTTNNASVFERDTATTRSKRKLSLPTQQSYLENRPDESIPSSSPSSSKRQRTTMLRRALPSTTTTATATTTRLTRSFTRSRSTLSSVPAPDPSSQSPSPSQSPSQSQSPTPTPQPEPSTPQSTSRRTRTRTRTPKPPTPPTTPSLLRDTIPANLDLLLVGVNPGILTGVTGHAYAHPSNLFWKLLHWSGITAIRHPPSDTYALPGLYNIGNTNIVERPTRDASMLSRAEMDAGVPVLEAKVAAQRPAVVCLVGKSIWEAVWRVKMGRNIRKEEFRYGWQDEGMNMGAVVPGDAGGGGDSSSPSPSSSSSAKGGKWPGARVFVATTTSGLAAGMSVAEKQAVWNELGEWVKHRRQEREQQQQQDRSVDEDKPSQGR